MTRNHNKHHTLENRVTFDFKQMSDLSQDLGATVNQTFGGYLRQPIHTHFDNQQHAYKISGNCALNDKDCSYFAPDKTVVDICWNCELYKTYEAKWIAQK